MYAFVTLSFLQSQFIEKSSKKTENSEQNVVLLLFLLTLENTSMCLMRVCAQSCVCAYRHARMCEYEHVRVHARRHVYVCAYRHACMREYGQAFVCMCVM